MCDPDSFVGQTPWGDITESKGTQQHLLEEVKLMQHALHKFRLEFRALEIRARALYKAQAHNMAPEDRKTWDTICIMKSSIYKEIDEMERLLSLRVKSIIAGKEIHYDGTDLASLQVINQMIELLKEQVYHGNIVNSMLPDRDPVLYELETVSSKHDESMAKPPPGATLMDQLALLQRQIQSQQNQTTSVLNSSMKDLRQVLLEEIRNSIHCETQDLRHQVQQAEQELQTLRRQMSAPSELSKLGQSANTYHIDVDIPETPNEL